MKLHSCFALAALFAISTNVCFAQSGLGKKSERSSSRSQSTTRKSSPPVRNEGRPQGAPVGSSTQGRSERTNQGSGKSVPRPRQTGDLGRPTQGDTGSSGRIVPSSQGLGRPTQDSRTTPPPGDTGWQRQQGRRQEGQVREVPNPSIGRVPGDQGRRQDDGRVVTSRPDRVEQLNSSSFNKKSGESRSGRVSYDGGHNVKTLGRPDFSGEMPRIDTGRIRREGHREDRVRVVDNRYRNGYRFYNDWWSDNCFWYPFYGFSYWDGCGYVCSPFYFYGHLPPYLSYTRISFGPFSWTRCETRYRWSPPRWDSYSDYSNARDFDSAVYSLERAFEQRSVRKISSLIPTQGRIEIEMDYGNHYAINGDDFYDMMRDLVEFTDTTSYRIVDVYRDGDQATINAVHEFRDSYGRIQCVRHTFGLENCGRGYEINYFSTDRG